MPDRTGGVPQRVVVGISGASGVVYGIRILDELRALGIETHLVVSKAAEMTLAYETDLTPRDLRARADHSYAVRDVGAAISSGSFRTLGMVVAPCSVRSLAEIANGVTSTLLTRAAEVTLKERRRLVLLVRESPLTLTHIRNLETATLMGATIALPVPAFYLRPESIDQLVDDGVARLLDHLGLDSSKRREWAGGRASIPENER
ncbi:UbiX family flavin prenyltransferase [Propionicicella superfundia]|uniref:UbiX family flavin prenyltransferase n=1 Tax=Propionicicella superfundia TaxID=348582 RepID=UPI000402C4BE|nr:UbiX family flavin prenyltransferase [Propionicicella superfundia]